MATIRRHTFVEVRFAGEVHRELRPDADGEWVRYDDHEAALASDRARIAAAIREETSRAASGIPDPTSDILARLLRVVEGK